MFRIPNWRAYQGYQKRGPKWVKLHVSLLRNKYWPKMSTLARATLPALWIVASEQSQDGSLDDDLESLAHLLSMNQFDLSKAVVELKLFGLIESDKSVADIATEVSHQTEKETESEERRGEGERANGHTPLDGKPLDEVECPICHKSGQMRLSQANGSHPPGFWCNKRGGCGANWPLSTEAILSQMTSRGRAAVERMLPAGEKPYVSPGMILTSELKFDDKGMLIE